MRIERLDHVQISLPPGGEERARAFYARVLGVTEVPKPAHLAARGGCWFENGAVKLHLGVEADFRPAKKAHPALIVSDLPALVRSLAENGFRVTEDQPLAGYDRCYVNDPFGNRLELMEPKVRFDGQAPT